MKHAHALCMILLLPLLAACAASTVLQPVSAGPTVKRDGVCHADRVAWPVGKPANEQVMKQAWQESGSGLVRPIAPGQALTRDFRPDRLNVSINASNVITQVNCG